jgi:hypothetical protein
MSFCGQGRLHSVRIFSQNTVSRALWTFVFATSTTLFAQGPFDATSSSLPEEPSPQTSSSSAQEKSSPSPQNEEEKKKQIEKQADQQLKEQEKQHLLGVVPTYNAVYSGQAVPLNGRQKFQLAFRSAITPYQFALTGIVAGIGQAQDSFPEYGQGMEGYAKRFGAGYTDTFNGTILGNALFPTLLHQDPRYFRKGTGSFSSRLWYSVSTTVRCKGDNGKWQPNVSNLLGNIAAGGISNLYYPESDRGVGLTFERGLVVTAEGAIGALLLEFAPDIEKRLLHKKPKSTQP